MVPVWIGYRLLKFTTPLPVISFFQMSPMSWDSLRNLVMRAYSPKISIGENCTILIWPQDPDLTFIGDNVIIGAGSSVVSHAFNASGTRFSYFSDTIEIGSNTTIGGECRIAMGVKIGAGALIEPTSNLLPYTRVGANEVWGGNPAVFIRKHSESEDDEGQKKMPETSISTLSLKSIIADAKNCRVNELFSTIGVNDMLGLESLEKMSIAAALYDRFNLHISVDDIFNIDSLSSLQDIVAQHLNNDLSATPTPSLHAIDIPNDPELLPLCDLDSITQTLSNHYNNSDYSTKGHVTIAATFVAEPLSSSFDTWCHAFGLPYSARFAEYNQLEQTLLDVNSPFAERSLLRC